MNTIHLVSSALTTAICLIGMGVSLTSWSKRPRTSSCLIGGLFSAILVNITVRPAGLWSAPAIDHPALALTFAVAFPLTIVLLFAATWQDGRWDLDSQSREDFQDFEGFEPADTRANDREDWEVGSGPADRDADLRTARQRVEEDRPPAERPMRPR